MILLPLAWTLLNVWSLTAGADNEVKLQNDNKHKGVLYPKISSNESVECVCEQTTCDQAFWYRILLSNLTFQYLGKCNNAERFVHGEVDPARFKFTKRGSNGFLLRIISVTSADAGVYSCVLKSKNIDLWRTGPLILPGETPPTVPPKLQPKPKEPPRTNTIKCCSSKKKEGCSHMVLWPMVGIITGLAVVLIGTLYYFSRLPKKCRHRFAKKRQTS